MILEDKMIQCIECPDQFEFTVGEQKYFVDKGFKEPKRCPACRQNKKIRNERNNNNDHKFNGY
jgi:hypothetical protein